MSRGTKSVVVRVRPELMDAVLADLGRLNSNPLCPQRTLSDWIRESMEARVAKAGRGRKPRKRKAIASPCPL